jgi:hypothetical protein
MEDVMLWRQGDIYIESAPSIPDGAIERHNTVLANGELTGHQHRIKDFRSAVVFEDRGRLFLNVLADNAQIVHEEHGTIHLKRGIYRVWRQREYDPRRDVRYRIAMD